MISYYTLKHLMKEFQEFVQNAIILNSLTPRKNVLEIYIKNDVKRYRIVIDTGNKFLTMFLDEYRPEKRSNTLHFFEIIKDSRITKLELAENDRLITMKLDKSYEIKIQLYSSRANVFLIDQSRIVETFKNANQYLGKMVPEPNPATLWNIPDENEATKKKIQKINTLFPRAWIDDIIEIHELKRKSNEELISFVRKITEQILESASPRILMDGRFCSLPETVIPLPVKERFSNVNEGIRTAYYRGINNSRFSDTRQELIRKIEAALAGYQKQYHNLQDKPEHFDRVEKYEQYGHILMANLHVDMPQYAKIIKLEDIFNPGTFLSIPLKPEMSLPENAQYYYEKARKTRKSFEIAKERKKIVSAKIDEFKLWLKELDQIKQYGDLSKWIKSHRNIPGTNDISGTEQIKPYRKIKVGKYEIWIGKNARSNDAIVKDAHKEDIWLHAKGVAGSHVLIRMLNDKQFPPNDMIQKAASLAAFYSKAKGSSMAPVSYTKKKFVRKPKGANPGLVYLDREEVIMVEPRKEF